MPVSKCFSWGLSTVCGTLASAATRFIPPLALSLTHTVIETTGVAPSLIAAGSVGVAGAFASQGVTAMSRPDQKNWDGSSWAKIIGSLTLGAGFAIGAAFIITASVCVSNMDYNNIHLDTGFNSTAFNGTNSIVDACVTGSDITQNNPFGLIVAAGLTTAGMFGGWAAKKIGDCCSSPAATDEHGINPGLYQRIP